MCAQPSLGPDGARYDTLREDGPPALSRRHVVGALAAGAGLAFASVAQSQPRWPDRPIRFVVPFPPGGNSDVLGRALAERLRDELGAVVTVDNRPGGTTQLGTELVARAEPDGYTMLLAAATAFTMLPNLRKLPYELKSHFEIAAGVAEYVAIVGVRKSLGVQSLAQFVALARQNPGRFTWGSAGQASAGHLYGEMLKRHFNLDMLHVPFKGSADAGTALLGDQIDMIIDGVALGFARSGRAVALATFFDQRHPELPEVPAVTEVATGLKLPPGGWGLAFPKGTPSAIVSRTGAVLRKILAESETRDRLLRASIVAGHVPADEYLRALEDGRQIYADLLRAVGMKQES